MCFGLLSERQQLFVSYLSFFFLTLPPTNDFELLVLVPLRSINSLTFVQQFLTAGVSQFFRAQGTRASLLPLLSLRYGKMKTMVTGMESEKDEKSLTSQDNNNNKTFSTFLTFATGFCTLGTQFARPRRWQLSTV